MPHRTRLTLAAPAPFELPLCLHGHGWVSLPPHRWDGGDAPWHVPLRLGRALVSARVRQRERRLAVELDSARPLSPRAQDTARAQLAHMLRLDDDLSAFWDACAATPGLEWVARRGGGRLLRSATVFEDLMKLLFTTNCTWAATTAMTRNLVQAIGPEAPDGARAFPTAAECDRGAAFYRDTVRAGYRSESCAMLAAAFARGELDDAQFLDPAQPTDALRKRLLSLRGFGPYAAGQAMRLLGHYDDLALDSWCRAVLQRRQGSRKPPADRTVARKFAPFGRHAGLALWCTLTADWHGE
ncbi:MAG: DNA-3-methyladenine glycosylase [Planctomycetota bacterium]